MNSPDRLECYDRIRNCMRDGIQRYYLDHPERLMDERSIMAIERSVQGLASMFAILDEYDIVRRRP